MAIDFPSSPSTNQEFLGTNGKLYFYDGSGWTTLSSALSSAPFGSNPFRYRTIFTRGYVAAGYKNSSPWKNINRTAHSTDVTTNLGDQLDQAGAYLDGGFSDYYQYVYGLGGSYSVSNTHTSGMNMATETGRTNSAWDMKTARVNHVAIMNSTLTAAYITGGTTTATDKHNYVTETMYAAGTAPANPATSGVSTKMLGQYRGWIVASGASAWIDFSTETWTNGGVTSGTDGYSKILSSKIGYGWGKSGTNTATTAITKWNDSTGTSSGVVCYSPDYGGEENMEMGQNWGYQLGNYNGAQNNNTYKLTYASDTCTGMGSSTQPSGHDGMSSGCCASASAYLLGSGY